jgi:glycosyltransferase involved in cell wall biosynthesis
MHLLIASVSAATSPSGVCRHAANIARGMLACSSVQKITLFMGDWQVDYFRDAFNLKSEKLEIRQISIRNRATVRNLWYLRGLPSAARACGADIVHLAYPIPLLRSAYASPVVVSLHDLYPFDIPQNFGRRAWLNRAALNLCLRNADAIACVSGETRTRLHQLFPAIESGKATVVSNSIWLSRGIGHTSLPPEILDHPFFLCVAQHRANKNLPLLLRSFRLALDRNVVASNTRLIVVGKEGPETQLLHRVIAQWNLEERVLFLRGISDPLLVSLYENCELVLAPSLLEGFGLPVAEASAVGSRIVCSDIPAFRSIGAAHCVFFDPLDESGESLLAAIREAMTSPFCPAMSSIGCEPRTAAAMYLDLYSRLLLPTPAKVSASSSAQIHAISSFPTFEQPYKNGETTPMKGANCPVSYSRGRGHGHV